MHKLFIWPVISVILFTWNYISTSRLVAHVDSCGMFDCALAYFGSNFFQEMIIGSFIMYVLFVALQYFQAKIKRKPMNYWLPVIVGPLSVPFVALILMMLAN